MIKVLFSSDFLSCPFAFLAGRYDAKRGDKENYEYARKARYFPENTKLVQLYLDSYCAGYASVNAEV